MASSKILQDKRDEILRIAGAGLRDVLIHDYMGVDIKPVWEITQKDLPASQKSIQENSQAMNEHGYRLNEIAAHLGVHYAMVSRRLKQIEQSG